MGYSSKIWRVSLCREMSPSPEFGAQDVFKNKCLINFRWYRSARTTPPNPPPRASDRVADPQPAVRSPSDATEPAAPLCWWTSGWWEPAQVCLRGPAWLLQSSMETILIVLAFSLNMEGYPFHSIFFFFGNDMNPSKVSSRVLWKRVKAKLDYQNKKAGGHDWSFWNRLLLQTWKKTFTHNEK